MGHVWHILFLLFQGAPTPAVEYDEIDSEDIDEGND